MPAPLVAARNLGSKVARRVAAVPARVVRVSRRLGRAREGMARVLDEHRIEREIAAVASGRGPIVVGPWLAEVGFEVLYWIPFLRWFAERYQIDPARMTAVSRGGVADWYADVAGGYVEILDHLSPEVFAARNARRQESDEAGGQKQHAPGALDRELLSLARETLGASDARVCHPSLMFRLFRQFWLGNRGLGLPLAHTRFASPAPGDGDLPPLPERFAAVKLYTGRALPDTPEWRGVLASLVARVAERMPVVLLDTGLALDEHEDYQFERPNVISLRGHLPPARNLGLQTRIIARASLFVGTCGSLAWLAPMLGVDTVAVYGDDRFLASHLHFAGHAFDAMGAASFEPLDLRAVTALDLFATAGDVRS